MRYLADRNPNLDSRFRDIAALLQAARRGACASAGTMPSSRCCWRPTILSFSRQRRGATSTAQNNFAGIGATGGGVPGDSFPDVSTRRAGADCSISSPTRASKCQAPAAPRTREKQDDIIAKSLTLRPSGALLGPHQPLGRRPQLRALDRASAERYRQAYCTPVRRSRSDQAADAWRGRGQAAGRGRARTPPETNAAPRAAEPPRCRLRRLAGQLRRLRRAADPLGRRHHGQLHGAAGRGRPGAAAGRRLLKAHAQRRADRAASGRAMRPWPAPSSFAPGPPDAAIGDTAILGFATAAYRLDAARHPGRSATLRGAATSMARHDDTAKRRREIATALISALLVGSLGIPAGAGTATPPSPAPPTTTARTPAASSAGSPSFRQEAAPAASRAPPSPPRSTA